jgi:peroxiredoxin
MAALNKGSKAPDFRLPLVGGGEFSLKEALAKSAVVIAFFKISCPVCQYAIPYYDRLAKRLQSAGVTLIGVSQDDLESTVDFMRRFGGNFPVAIDNPKGYPVSNAYGLTNVPTLFEIAQDGKITLSSVSWSRDEVAEVFARHVSDAKKAPLFEPKEMVAELRVG